MRSTTAARSRRARAAPLPAAAALAALLLAGCATDRAAARLSREWLDLGDSWAEQKKWDKAGAAYARALALEPGLAAASYNWARALAQAGEHGRALAILERLGPEERDNLRVLSLRAYCLHASGRHEEALAAYDAVLRLDPFAPDAVFNSVVLRRAAGDLAGAAVDAARLVAARPEDWEARALHAELAAETGDRAAAVAAYEALRGAGKASGRQLAALAALREAGEAYAAAIEAYAEAVKADATLPEAYAEAVKADATLPEAWFALARLRLVRAEDGPGGLEALRGALAAGFADGEAARALVAVPGLPERAAVERLLDDKGLLKEPESDAARPASGSPSVEGTAATAPSEGTKP